MNLPGLRVPNQELTRHLLEKEVLAVDFFEVDQLLHGYSCANLVLLLHWLHDKLRP